MTTSEPAGALRHSHPVALVTGAATGIGEAAVRALAASGMTVVGTDVDHERGERLFAALGAPHSYLPLDVRVTGEWAQVVATIVGKFGRIDFAHLNAGVMSRPKGAPLMDDPLDWFTQEGYEKVIGVNLGGVVHGIQAVLGAPGLSRICVTASGAAILPLDLDPYYTASKFGVLGLGLALEAPLARRGVRIDILCPGAIGTDLTAPDIRTAVRQEPASFVGEAVATLASTDEVGPIWLAFTQEEGLRRYDLPGISGAAGALDVTRKEA